jgi:hypothetical protein
MAKSGIVAVTLAVEHICRVLVSYDVKLRAAIDLAVTSGKITADEAEIAKAFLSSAQIACAIFRAASGY